MVGIVTGSSKGIGRELIIGLAKKGIDVVITYNANEEKSNELKSYVEENYNVNALSVKCDISKEEDIVNLKNKVLNKYNRIDILINNAALSLDNSIDEKTKEEFMKVLEVNVVGTFLVIKHLYKNMKNGIIVNISSTDSIDTYNTFNIDYSVSKSGINMITKVCADAFKDVKVISVLPNWTNTESIREMNPEFLKEELKRIGQKELEDPAIVSNNIISLIFDENVKTGELRRV